MNYLRNDLPFKLRSFGEGWGGLPRHSLTALTAVLIGNESLKNSFPGAGWFAHQNAGKESRRTPGHDHAAVLLSLAIPCNVKINKAALSCLPLSSGGWVEGKCLWGLQ